MSRRMHFLYLAVVVLFVGGGLLQAQTTFATVTGSVVDATGAVIPGVKVTARNSATGTETSATSNDAGIYTLAQLREGEYTVTARGSGFKEFVAQKVVLVARDMRRLDVTLEVGALETRVEVSAGATLIETETARISDTKTADVLKSIPLNTRGIWAFLALSPNVLQAAGSSTIRFAGSGSNQSHWAIDGTTMSDGVDETQIGPLANYIESFQEIKLDISNNTAEFGTIGQVTMISKSGTNALHGNIFDYYSTPWFRARNPFALARGTGIGHTPGGSVGGPVYIPKIYNGKDKTFFFFSFETGRGSQTTQSLNPTVPLPAWRNGDFSGLSVKIYDPTTGLPFTDNKIPTAQINSVSKKIQEMFYPLPNYGSTTTLVSQNYREDKTRSYDPSTYWTTRGDHRFSDRDSLFGRFTYLVGWNLPYEGNLPAIGQRYQRRADRGATLAYTHTFNPTLLNEFRWGMALNNNPNWGPINGLENVKTLGLVGLAPDLPDLPGIFKVNWSGVGLQGISQNDYTNPGFRNHLEEFQEHVSWFRGKHNLKVGLDLTRVEYDNMSANGSLFGNVTFSNRFSSGGVSGQGHPYADFLLGIPTTASRAFAPVRANRNRWQYDFFVADDFKVSPKLTLNFGLRYELHKPWRENDNLISLFDIKSGKIVIADGASSRVSSLMPKGYVSVVEASSVGLPGRTLLKTDRNNIVPRIGIAYRPWGAKTVFRTGFGMFYDVVPRTLNMAGIPFVINEPSYTNPTTNPDVIFPRVFPITSTGGPSTVGIPAAVNPDLNIPYSFQYNVTIEHQRWDTGFRLSYVGTATRQTDWAYDINSPVPDSRPYVDKPRRFPNYPGISYYTNGAGHQYHGLTASAERNMAKGLYFQSSWTWARDIYDLNRGESPENPFDRQREVAVAADIPTHRLNTNLVYQMPFGKGRKFLSGASRAADLLVGGWEISGIYSYYSGQFLTPMWTGPDPTGTAYTTSKTAPSVTRRPNQLSNGNLPTDQRSVNRWFDAGAFTGPASGTYGSSAKNVIKGPNANVWHVGLFKNFNLAAERARLRWEMTATNFFNHPNWSNPAMNISQTANVGVISGVGGVNGSSTGDQPGPRNFRMGLRLEF